MTADEIHALPLFKHVPRRRHGEVGRMAERLTVPAGKTVITQGELAHEFFVIISGVADVFVDERPLAMLGRGDFFGEVGLVGGEPYRTATVVAVSELDVAVLARREFRSLLMLYPDLAATVLFTGSRRVITTLRDVEQSRSERSLLGANVSVAPAFAA